MAGAIAVGDTHPMCDTFTTGPIQAEVGKGQVGACNVTL